MKAKPVETLVKVVRLRQAQEVATKRQSNREAEEERLRRCWPWQKAPAEDEAARGEEVERPLPLSSDLDMARLEDISDDCCT